MKKGKLLVALLATVALIGCGEVVSTTVAPTTTATPTTTTKPTTQTPTTQTPTTGDTGTTSNPSITSGDMDLPDLPN